MRLSCWGILTSVLFCWGFVLASGAELVREGEARAEIVVARDALPQVGFAARELQAHLREMTGATLPVLEAPGGRLPVVVYVGESEASKRAGYDASELALEHYRICVAGNTVALMGGDADFPAFPRDYRSLYDRKRLLAEWQRETGETWDFPHRGLYDPRNESKFGFSLYDPTGTLFAAYALLEQLGIRWYMPDPELGTVIPKRSDVVVPLQDVREGPAFRRRWIRFSFPSQDPEGFLWFKRQRLGMSEMLWIGHGTPNVTRYSKETHPEYFARVKGRLLTDVPGQRNCPGRPRLAAPLRDAMARYADAALERYPGLRCVPVAPADGFTAIDDRDAAAGAVREGCGAKGRFSGYVWGFVEGVASQMATRRPGKIAMGLAYSTYRRPPEGLERLSGNVGVTYCQSRAFEHVFEESRRENTRWREEWLGALTSGMFTTWEYYLYHEDRKRLPGVPVFFSRIMQEDARLLKGRSEGEYLECSGSGRMVNPGLNHLTYHLQARLYWDPDMDMEAAISEYCRLFYGPAWAQMRAFWRFAEEVWMRPASRDLQDEGAFLRSEDVDRFFSILDEAESRVEEGSLFSRRLSRIRKECEPMRAAFAFERAWREGIEAVDAREGERAREALERAVACAPDSVGRGEAMSRLGRVYRDLLHREGDALEVFLRLAELPMSRKKAIRFDARMSAVDILIRAKRYAEARRLLDAHDIKSGHGSWNFRVLGAYGRLAEARGETEEALRLYREALAIEGAHPYYVRKLQERVRAMESAAGQNSPLPTRRHEEGKP